MAFNERNSKCCNSFPQEWNYNNKCDRGFCQEEKKDDKDMNCCCRCRWNEERQWGDKDCDEKNYGREEKDFHRSYDDKKFDDKNNDYNDRKYDKNNDYNDRKCDRKYDYDDKEYGNDNHDCDYKHDDRCECHENRRCRRGCFCIRFF